MRKLLFILFLIVLKPCVSQETTSYHQLITNEFKGDLAYNTTGFVEKYWRVVGNKGFNESIYKIAEELEKAGYIKEENATNTTVLTYRIEKRPLKKQTWEPINALVKINGENTPLLKFETNRNMIAINSYSTPKAGITAEVIYVKDVAKIKNKDVKGKIVFVETSPGRIFNAAVVRGGALGIVSYNNPKYLQPQKNTTSIQFRGIPLNKEHKSWAIPLSYEAKERLKESLKKGKTTLNVFVETKIYDSEELTIVADVKGSEHLKERLVFSAHVQEPGANDNATGVGVAVEMASVTAKLIQEKKYIPKTSLTFLWGDEIVSTRRYVQEDKERAKDIKWGISLDMVGENTALTGGSFLIEKMPDPSAIWTRGNDKHTEWGGSPMTLNDMKPHYLNDFLMNKFKAQGKRENWTVNNNPFEGGSDHVPFLKSGIPSVLFWHFTDQFYHTDNDRLDKVSKETLKNVGITALEAAFTLLNAEENTSKSIINEVKQAAITRLKQELKQGQLAIKKGEPVAQQKKIIKAWEDWYIKALASTNDLLKDKSSVKLEIEKAQKEVKQISKDVLAKLN